MKWLNNIDSSHCACLYLSDQCCIREWWSDVRVFVEFIFVLWKQTRERSERCLFWWCFYFGVWSICNGDCSICFTWRQWVYQRVVVMSYCASTWRTTRCLFLTAAGRSTGRAHRFGGHLGWVWWGKGVQVVGDGAWTELKATQADKQVNKGKRIEELMEKQNKWKYSTECNRAIRFGAFL